MAERPFGFLNIDKPAGKSSRFVVDHVARLVRPAKAGHAGTLDPLATGVLIVCVGQATRLIEFVHGFDKSYLAAFRLGCTSETDDIEGDVVENPEAVPVSREQIEAALPRFLGEIQQTPPRFSAVHVRGKRAYELARRGREVNLPPRTVHIKSLRITQFEWPRLQLDVVCGSGTYIRSLGRDLGEALGTGAVMTDLRRTAIGPWRSDDAVPLEELSKPTWRTHLHPAVTALPQFQQYTATEAQLTELRHGRRIVPQDFTPVSPEEIAVLTPHGELACLARFDSHSGELLPKMVFPPG